MITFCSTICKRLFITLCLTPLAFIGTTHATIIDNTDANFLASGNWPSGTGVAGYYGSNYQYTNAGNGSRTATWQFTIVDTGIYDVSAQWAAHPNRAPNAPYTIYNNGSFVAQVSANQQVNGNQFNLLGAYTLAAGTVDIVLDNNASGFVVADAVQLTYVGPAANIPPNGVIDSPSGNVTITTGDFVSFAGTYSDQDNDPVDSYLWEFGAGSGLADSIAEDPGSLQFNNTGTFVVRFTVTDSIGDPDPTPDEVTITVVDPGSSFILDNSDATFNAVGNWGTSSGVAGFYGSNYAYTNKGNGSRTASWQFNVNATGNYEIAAQWAAHANRASNAPYAIYNNGVFVGQVTANQQTNGNQFNVLGTFVLSAGTAEVIMDNDANGFVVADAIQVTFTGVVSNQPPNGTIAAPGSNLTIEAGEMVNFAGTYSDPEGDPAQTYLWTFGTGSGIANNNAEDPGALTFNNVGTFNVTFTVTDSNSNVDPTPDQVTVTVIASGGSDIIDNTDPEFSFVGNWATSSGVSGYYGSNYHYTSKGNGSRTATWATSISSPGDYDIEAHWASHPNRATNTRYTIYNNGLFVGMVRVDQQTNGSQFNLLGSYSLAAGSLDIVVDNDSNGTVVADAVRIVQNGTPQITITSPLDNVLSTATFMTINVANSNVPVGWGVEFVLDGNPATSFISHSAPFSHTFTSLAQAEHFVDVYLVDDSDVRQSGISKHVGFGIGDYHVAFGDSITRGLSDDFPSDDTSLDGRNTGGGYEPLLNNQLTSKSGYPQTVINSGVSGDKSSTAITRLPDVLIGNPDSNYVLILLGTNDAFFANLDSGEGLVPGNPGYTNSYKDYMQQIITEVVSSGKIPVLGKVLQVQPASDPSNVLIQEYNNVIDELRLANGIIQVAPDFYSHFAANPGLYVDNLHPSGLGYIDMADMWSDSFTY